MYSFDNKVLANDSVNRKGCVGGDRSSHHQGHWPSGFSALNNNCIQYTELHLNHNVVYSEVSENVDSVQAQCVKIIFLYFGLFILKKEKKNIRTGPTKSQRVLNVNIFLRIWTPLNKNTKTLFALHLHIIIINDMSSAINSGDRLFSVKYRKYSPKS